MAHPAQPRASRIGRCHGPLTSVRLVWPAYPQVTYRARQRTFFHGMQVTPSGRLPLLHKSLHCSSRNGTSSAYNAALIMPLIADCLGTRPANLRQLNTCRVDRGRHIRIDTVWIRSPKSHSNSVPCPRSSEQGPTSDSKTAYTRKHQTMSPMPQQDEPGFNYIRSADNKVAANTLSNFTLLPLPMTSSAMRCSWLRQSTSFDPPLPTDEEAKLLKRSQQILWQKQWKQVKPPPKRIWSLVLPRCLATETASKCHPVSDVRNGL